MPSLREHLMREHGIRVPLMTRAAPPPPLPPLRTDHGVLWVLVLAVALAMAWLAGLLAPVCRARRQRCRENQAQPLRAVARHGGSPPKPPATARAGSRVLRARSTKAEAAHAARVRQVLDGWRHQAAVAHLLFVHRAVAERQSGARSFGGVQLEDCTDAYWRLVRFVRSWPAAAAVPLTQRNKWRAYRCGSALRLPIRACTAIATAFALLHLLAFFPGFWLACATGLMLSAEDVLAAVSFGLFLNPRARAARSAVRRISLARLELPADARPAERLRAAQAVAVAYAAQAAGPYAEYFGAAAQAALWHALVVYAIGASAYAILRALDLDSRHFLHVLQVPWHALFWVYLARTLPLTRRAVEASVSALSRFRVAVPGKAAAELADADVAVGLWVRLLDDEAAFAKALAADAGGSPDLSRDEVLALLGSRQQVCGRPTPGHFDVFAFAPAAPRWPVLGTARPPQAALTLPFGAIAEAGARERPLRQLLAEFEAQDGMEREVDKYTDGRLVLGEPHDAALGVHALVRVPEKVVWRGLADGLTAMCAEVDAGGSADDRECLEYVLRQPAGSLQRRWPHSGNKMMDHFNDPAKSDGREGRTLEYFVRHEYSRNAKLLLEHVLALRLYTTAAYRTINTNLRVGADVDEPHPFPVTVAYLAEAIRRLRAMDAGRRRVPPADLWRGMRNVAVDEASGFRELGGTETAPMSTSASFQVALEYSSRAEKRLLFKVRTSGFIDRGADLYYLSAFPEETEFLYPPLTYLEPTGDEELVTLVGGIEYTVIEVVPHISS